MTKHKEDAWEEKAKKLRQEVDRRPILKIRDVMRILGLSSTSTADYNLKELAKRGKAVKNGDDWRLL